MVRGRQSKGEGENETKEEKIYKVKERRKTKERKNIKINNCSRQTNLEALTGTEMPSPRGPMLPDHNLGYV